MAGEPEHEIMQERLARLILMHLGVLQDLKLPSQEVQTRSNLDVPN